MNRKLSQVFIVVFFLFTTNFIAFAADSPQDAIAKNKVKLQQMNDSITETNNKISNLNSQMDKLNITIEKNKTDINKTENQIKDAESQMVPLKKAIESSQKLANSRIRASYMNNHIKSFMTLLLSSKNMSDLVFNYEATSKIISYDNKIMNDLKTKKSELSGIINDLNIKTQQLQQLKSSNEANLKQLSDQKEKLKNLIAQFDGEKKSSALIIKENEKILIAHAISVIDSQSSTINDLKNAIETLKSLAPQLSTDSVKQTANDYINTANVKLADLEAKSIKQAEAAAAMDNVTGTYKTAYNMSATAYTVGTLTAMGLKPVRDPSGLSTIAVDPDVIPLGTKVYIPGYGNAICSDTGALIKGDIVDLYFNSADECTTWGRQPVTVNIIAYPGEW